MGCWNKTCGISQLPIIAGDRVYTFVLEKNPSETERCYSTAFWAPIPLPFECDYNDYGGGENSDVNLQVILSQLKNKIVPMELSKNEYHDIAVDPEKLDEELFFESVHESRLLVKNYFGENSPLDFVMLRKDVVDYILENDVREVYVGGGNGTHGYGNNYTSFKFSDVVAAVPAYVDRLAKELLELDPKDPKNNEAIFRLINYRGFHGVYEWEDRNIVQSFLPNDGGGGFTSRVAGFFSEVVQLIDVDRDAAIKMVTDLARGGFINSFMEHTRKNWAPGGHEGSQSAEYPQYRVLTAAITASIDETERHHNEDFGED